MEGWALSVAHRESYTIVGLVRLQLNGAHSLSEEAIFFHLLNFVVQRCVVESQLKVCVRCFFSFDDASIFIEFLHGVIPRRL